jgi:DNA-binding phage protein
MPRIPCSFSAQEEVIAQIDARAAALGMKRSEYIVHALRAEIAGGGNMSIVAEQRGGYGNTINQSLSHLPSDVSARTGAKAAGKKPKRKK